MTASDTSADEQTILFLNDHEDTVDLMVVMLQAAGFKVEGFTEPDQAMERLTKGPAPCLLIVDYKIGPVRGDDFIRQVQAAGIRVPTVLLTAASLSPDARATVCRLGVTEILEKPIGMDRIERLITRYGRNECKPAA